MSKPAKVLNFIQRATTYFNIASYMDGSGGYSYQDLQDKYHVGMNPTEINNKIVIQENGNLTVFSNAPYNPTQLVNDLAAFMSLPPSTAGSTQGSVAGPFSIIGGTNDQLLLSINGGPQVAITLIAGAARTAAQICTDINTALGAPIATVVANEVLLTSPTVGTASSVNVLAPAQHSANPIIGFAVGNHVGTGITIQ